MRKENPQFSGLIDEFLSITPKDTEYYKVCQIALPLIEKSIGINGPRIYSPQEAHKLIPQFNKMFKTFRWNQEYLDGIFDEIAHYRKIYQKNGIPLSFQTARRYLHQIYPDNFGQWPAVWALELGCFNHKNSGLGGLFDNNPFYQALSFYEKGVKLEEFNPIVHILLDKEKSIWVYWQLGDDKISLHHPSTKDQSKDLHFLG